jgi:hypothetical protein
MFIKVVFSIDIVIIFVNVPSHAIELKKLLKLCNEREVRRTGFTGFFLYLIF